MPSLKFFMLFLFFSILSYLISFAAALDTTYVTHSCPNATFTRNSTFKSNLNLLLSSLPSNDSRSNAFSSGFLNATVGQDPDRVYGIFLCRGDQTTSGCQDCVNFATNNIKQRCSSAKQAIVWCAECILRYSNRSFFSIMDTEPSVQLYNVGNVDERAKFDEQVGTLMNEIATQAVNNPKKFATKKANYDTFQTLYSLAQCTPDLSSRDCDVCLRGAIAQLPNCCSGRPGGRVLRPSCNIRYEVYPFYNEDTASPAPTPVVRSPPPPVPVTGSKGKSGMSSTTIIAIVAPIAVSAVLFIAGFCFLKRRAKKYNAVSLENADNDIPTLESLQFDLGTIEVATNRFSMDNKLGEGGFGEVYKV